MEEPGPVGIEAADSVVSVGVGPVGTASGPLGVVQAADREIARQTAVRARAVAEFAATRPAAGDRPAGQPGAMSAERRAARAEVLAGVSEWAAQELVVALSISTGAAETLLTRSLILVHRLPGMLAALQSGALHTGHLWTMLETVAPIADPVVRREVESGLLAWAAGRVTTPAQLGAKARRMVLARDARGAAQRLTAALRRRGVTVRPEGAGGMATVTALLTVPEAQALQDALGRYADELDDEPGRPPRSRGQKMADCLLDLVLRPEETDLPAVRAQLTVVAGVATLVGGDVPGEVGGEPVPAEMVRALARALGLLPAEQSTDPAAAPNAAAPNAVAPHAAHPDAADADADADADAVAGQVELARWWAEVEDRALTEEWGGAEAPPSEELERYWARQAVWEAEETGEQSCHRPPRDPDPEGGAPDPVPAAGWWEAADRAVAEASELCWGVAVALGRARGAVARAGIADANDEQAGQQDSNGQLAAAEDAITALVGLSAEARAELAALLEATEGGGLVDRPRIAVVDAVSGALLALTDSRELRRLSACTRPACRRDPGSCTHDLTGAPGLAPPPPTAGYRPGAVLDRYVRARDRRCRFPGCRNRVPRGGELDHDRPWPEGPTSAGNLTGYCTSHHRGKHQAPGWQHDLAADGTLTVITPTGLAATTTPPPY